MKSNFLSGVMKKIFRKFAAPFAEKLSNRIAGSVSDKLCARPELADNIAYRLVLETFLENWGQDRKPNDLFKGISDGF